MNIQSDKLKEISKRYIKSKCNTIATRKGSFFLSNFLHSLRIVATH